VCLAGALCLTGVGVPRRCTVGAFLNIPRGQIECGCGSISSRKISDPDLTKKRIRNTGRWIDILRDRQTIRRTCRYISIKVDKWIYAHIARYGDLNIYVLVGVSVDGEIGRQIDR
jgi:hypothetical protein